MQAANEIVSHTASAESYSWSPRLSDGNLATTQRYMRTVYKTIPSEREFLDVLEGLDVYDESISRVRRTITDCKERVMLQVGLISSLDDVRADILAKTVSIMEQCVAIENTHKQSRLDSSIETLAKSAEIFALELGKMKVILSELYRMFSRIDKECIGKGLNCAFCYCLYSLLYNPEAMAKLLVDAATKYRPVALFLYNAVKDRPISFILEHLQTMNDKSAEYVTEMKATIKTINRFAYAGQYRNHLFILDICRMSPINRSNVKCYNDWDECVILAGIGREFLVKHNIAIRTHFMVLADTPPEAVNEHFTTSAATLSARDKQNAVFDFIRVDYCEAIETCLDSGWVNLGLQKVANGTATFLEQVIRRGFSLCGIYHVIDKMKTIDIWNSSGLRVLHYLIDRKNEEETLTLFYRFCDSKFSVEESNLDKISLIDYCREHKKPKLESFIKLHRQLKTLICIVFGGRPSELNFILQRLCLGIHEITTINAETNTNYDRDDLVMVDLSNPQRKSNALKLREIFRRLGVKFFVRDAEPNYYYIEVKNLYAIVEAATRKPKTLKLDEEIKKPKKVKATRAAAPIEFENASIMPIGNGTKVEAVKNPVVAEVYEIKFTDADRDVVYLRLHDERNARLFRIFATHRQFDDCPIQVSRMTLVEFKLKAEIGLGQFYSDEVACIVYAQQHYDPKTASAFEKAKCSSHYQMFRSRDLEPVEVCAVANDSIDVILVNPFKALKESKAMLKKPAVVSANLTSAKHEFLFLKGLWSWRVELQKPEKVHEDIFEDCARLGVIRFYNSIMLYTREIKELDRVKIITLDDSEAAHMRNIMVHNFIYIDQLKTHVENMLFPLGERILSMCNGKNVIANTRLSHLEIYKQEVKRFDAVDCRLMILKLLDRVKVYVKVVESKQDLSKNSTILTSLNADWERLSPELKIWIHHARAIESALLQIGELSRNAGKFLNPTVMKYVSLCREIRHIGYHENSKDEEWNFDPISPEFLADLIKGCV